MPLAEESLKLRTSRDDLDDGDQHHGDIENGNASHPPSAASSVIAGAATAHDEASSNSAEIVRAGRMNLKGILGCMHDGMGMFGEAFVVFSIGNIFPIFDAAYPDCFHGGGCNAHLLRSITYSEIAGIILGMICIGMIADVYGRRVGAIMTSALMLLGVILLAASAGPTENSQFLMFTISLTLFGFGVGGEYPIASASAAEKSEAIRKARALEEIKRQHRHHVQLLQQQQQQQDYVPPEGKSISRSNSNSSLASAGSASSNTSPNKKKMKRKNGDASSSLNNGDDNNSEEFNDSSSTISLNVIEIEDRDAVQRKLSPAANSDRGKRVVFTFSMQGLGNWCNTAVFLLLLLFVGQSGSSRDADRTRLEVVWRGQYTLGAIILTYLVLRRLFRLKESDSWKAAQAKRAAEAEKGGNLKNDKGNNDQSSMRMLFIRKYWHRLVGASMGWLLWDVSFYGVKLVMSKIVKLMHPGASPFEIMEWTLANSTVALSGYYVAAMTIDKPWMGRNRMQNMGFIVTFVLFTACGIFFDTLITPNYLGLFQFLFFLINFFGQFGPNATTWLIPSEIFPTDMRTFAHGISAAAGKVGALLAGILFSYISDPAKFYLAGITGLMGLIFTVLFVPDVTTMSLEENDRYWDKVVAGKEEEYVGRYTDKEYLSLYEKWRMGGGGRGGQKRLLLSSEGEEMEEVENGRGGRG